MLNLIDYQNHKFSQLNIVSFSYYNYPLLQNLQWHVNYEWKLIDTTTLSCPFKVRDYNTKNGTIKWHSIRRQKREWIKFAAACREGEDNSKRNPIAKVSINTKRKIKN